MFSTKSKVLMETAFGGRPSDDSVIKFEVHLQ